MSKVIALVGPTCTGKTSLAVNLCKKFNGVIISADSRQVVRYMDIGTGKVPVGLNDRGVTRSADKWTVDGVDVYGYDLVNPNEFFSAYDFAEYVKKLFSRKSLNGNNIFLVGGTGFYIDAVTGRASLAQVPPDFELRKSLEGLSIDQLRVRLKRLDKEAYKKVDIENPSRMLRAIEKALQVKTSGAVAISTPLITNPVYLGLTSERQALYSRADTWIDSIFSDKLFAEIESIQKQFPLSHRLNGLVYKSVLSYLNGELEFANAKQRAKFDMHAYIRRQQTWFKKNSATKWFDISQINFDVGITSIVESEING